MKTSSPSPSNSNQYDDFSRANCVKKGALFGFALGMLVGLIWIGIAPPEESNEIGSAALDRWRNVILAGIGSGLVIGAFWPDRTKTNSSVKDSPET